MYDSLNVFPELIDALCPFFAQNPDYLYIRDFLSFFIFLVVLVSFIKTFGAMIKTFK